MTGCEAASASWRFSSAPSADSSFGRPGSSSGRHARAGRERIISLGTQPRSLMIPRRERELSAGPVRVRRLGNPFMTIALACVHALQASRRGTSLRDPDFLPGRQGEGVDVGVQLEDRRRSCRTSRRSTRACRPCERGRRAALSASSSCLPSSSAKSRPASSSPRGGVAVEPPLDEDDQRDRSAEEGCRGNQPGRPFSPLCSTTPRPPRPRRGGGAASAAAALRQSAPSTRKA